MGGELEEGTSPDTGIGVEESLGRFEGRKSTSGSRRICSVAMSEAVDESASDQVARRDRFRLLTCDNASPSSTKTKSSLRKQFPVSQRETSFSR